MKKLLSMITMITMITIAFSTTTVFGAGTTIIDNQEAIKIQLAEKKVPVGDKVKQVGDIAPYTFSQTPLDYPYNVFIEGKGYMNFGKDKPFVENGGIYLPLKHFAYFNNYNVLWDAATNSITLNREYTEENSPTNERFVLRGDLAEKFVEEANGLKFIRASEGKVACSYMNRESIVMGLNRSNVVYNEYSLFSKWGEQFLKDGGVILTDIGYGPVFLGYNNYAPYNDGKTPAPYTLTMDYKIISRNGAAYIQRTDLGATLANTMLLSEHNKTLYYGSQEYLQKVMEEVVNPNLKMNDTFNNGKSYEDVMNDVFKNAEDYSQR